MTESSRPIKEESNRLVVKASPSVFLSERQKKAIELDRRQLRRKIAEKLEARGEKEDFESLFNDYDDDERTVYDDLELFPWRQREAAIDAEVCKLKIFLSHQTLKLL